MVRYEHQAKSRDAKKNDNNRLDNDIVLSGCKKVSIKAKPRDGSLRSSIDYNRHLYINICFVLENVN